MITSRVVIIHGSYGNPDENWIPWLASQMRSDGHQIIVPDLPTPEGQSLDTWRRSFELQVGDLDENVVLIGHSLGAAFILRLLEVSPRPVKGIALVSGFLGELGDERFDTVNRTFTEGAMNWTKINASRGPALLLMGEDDPYVPLEKGYELSRAMNVPITLIPRGGHLNESAGYREFPFLLESLYAFVMGPRASFVN